MLTVLLGAGLTVAPAGAQRGGRGGPAAPPLPSAAPQFKFMGPAFRQHFKRCEQRLGVFLLSEPSHIEQKFSIRRDARYGIDRRP